MQAEDAHQLGAPISGAADAGKGAEEASPDLAQGRDAMLDPADEIGMFGARHRLRAR